MTRHGPFTTRITASTAPPATLLVRAVVGAVFLLEGILKFINPQELGVGRFVKIGIPFPSFFAPFDGVFEIACGVLLILGLMTRLGAISMIVNMIVAITSTKIPMLLHDGFFKAAHEARLDVSMLLACIFLLRVGAGPLSLDSLFAREEIEAPSLARRFVLGKTVVSILAAGLVIAGASGRALAADTASQGGARTVEVRLTEYRIEMPLEWSAGRTLFKVTNAGTMLHRFEIEGKGIEEEIEDGVEAGQSTTLELDLKPGVYEVYCPMRGHKKAGMSLRVKVT
ncbi:MAG: DoxX family membrane protein [Acidobacteria bacterium]|nr:DoxX family membrane protein [Acidobacteriota bacterium]